MLDDMCQTVYRQWRRGLKSNFFCFRGGRSAPKLGSRVRIGRRMKPACAPSRATLCSACGAEMDLSCDAKVFAAVILLAVPTVQYGAFSSWDR